MRRRLQLSVLRRLVPLALLLCALPLAAQDLRSEIEARNREMSAALERGDGLAVARIYADDARLLGPGDEEPVVGREAIDRYWTRIRNVKRWELDVLEVGGSRDDAYQVGRSTLVHGEGEKQRTSIVDFVLLWKRGADGKLYIHLDFYH